MRKNLDTVYFAGSIRTSGTNMTAFYEKGYLKIMASDGAATVGWNDGGTQSDAQCFASLEGVSYAQTASGFTPMTLKNGWITAPIFSLHLAAERVTAGLVQLQVGIANGTSAVRSRCRRRCAR